MIIDDAEQQSIEDRLMNVLGDEPEEEQELAEPTDEDVEVEAEADDEEVEAEPIRLKLKRGEEEVEVDLEEARNLAQQGYDYTKKTQEVAEQRKQVEMFAQAVKAQEQALQQHVALQQAFIKDIAKVESINEQIAQFDQVDWQSLSDSDPVQAQKFWIQYQTLQNKRTQAQNEIAQKQQRLQYETSQRNEMVLAQAKAELLKTFPDWNAEKAQELREAGKSYGYTDKELSAVTDPRTVKLLADAAAYRKLQAEKSSVSKKVQGKPPVVKPGAKDTNAVAKTRRSEMRQTLKKTGRMEDAAELIERML